MRRLFALALSAAALLAAQGPDSLSSWQFFRELSDGPETGVAVFELDPETLAHTRDDAADLRVLDAAGKEVPYELRVLRGERTVEPVQASEISRAAEGDVAEIVLDLGQSPPEHNQVEVDTEGSSFRRQVSVFGSDDAEQWTPLTASGLIFALTANGKTAAANRVPYQLSEFRYVRISVARDPQTDTEPPVIKSVAVQRATVIQGEEQEIAAASVSKETIGEGERSASVYTIELPDRIPLHALRFSTAPGPFVRTYRLLSVVSDKVVPLPVSVGRIGRREGDSSEVVTLRFEEIFAQRLQLTIVDGAEPPLDVLRPVGLMVTRQIVADLSATIEQPLRLYYGDPTAAVPDYDFQAELPHTLDESVTRLSLGDQQLNPNYVAPEPPLRESAPWLVYLLTGAASLGLLAILRSLVFNLDS